MAQERQVGVHDDTAIGGPHGRFPVTRVSVIQNIRSAEMPLREAARELLVTAYWKPVYKHIRLKWNRSNEDAKDLTQSFFAHALEKDLLSGYDPDKAAFRTYLRTCLDRFVANQAQSAARMKRGGGIPGISLDFEQAAAEFMRHVAAGQSVEELFEKETVRSVFEMALERVRTEFASRNPTAWRVFERYDLDPRDGKLTYQQIAAQFEIGATDVTNYLSAVRTRLRQVVRETGAALGIEV